jgi:hypothetical protein
VFCNRKDLAKELRRLALANDGEGLPANLRIGKKVVACDPDEGNLTLDDGEAIHADVILGCDGIGVAYYSKSLSALKLIVHSPSFAPASSDTTRKHRRPDGPASAPDSMR